MFNCSKFILKDVLFEKPTTERIILFLDIRIFDEDVENLQKYNAS